MVYVRIEFLVTLVFVRLVFMEADANIILMNVVQTHVHKDYVQTSIMIIAVIVEQDGEGKTVQ